jgi:hypothetical protein
MLSHVVVDEDAGIELPITLKMARYLEGEGVIWAGYSDRAFGEATWHTTAEWDHACAMWPVHPIAAIIYLYGGS